MQMKNYTDMEQYLNIVKYKSAIFENDYVYFWMEGEILCNAYKKDALIGAEAAWEVINFRKKHFPGDQLVMIFMSNIKCLDEAGKKVFASEESYEGISKLALITTNVFQQIFGNFYLRCSMTNIPTKILLSKRDAVTWLLKK